MLVQKVRALRSYSNEERMVPSAKSFGYHQLAVRLNKFPLGAPCSKQLYDILKILFSPAEARLVSLLPIRVFRAKHAARAWKMPLAEARRKLDDLCRKALLVDIEQEGSMHYCLPPPMAGFFEFSMMRVRNDIDQKALARLLYQYINLEKDFSQALFTGGRTQLGRIFVNEPQVEAAYRLEILAHESATEVIRSSTHIALSRCYCRHKMAHVGLACDAPQNICLTLDITAASLVRHGHASAIDAARALDVLQQARDLNLVQFGENVRDQVNFICNCCKCCCEGLQAARRFAMHSPVLTTNFEAAVDNEKCSHCGRCAAVCPVEAIVTPGPGQDGLTQVAEHLCLGCGVCVKVCSAAALRIVPRPQRVVTPVNTAHRVMLMAIERERLQHIIFDNQVLHSHRALAAFLGALFRLSPVKRLLASRQLKSRYLEALIQRLGWQPVPDTPPRRLAN
jgi:Pyruvate/2-oxoacid:ferredoxin oxidoreductase delta subunit